MEELRVCKGINHKEVWHHFCWAPRLGALQDSDLVRCGDPVRSPPGGGA